jgi:hypothetical protein
MKTLKRPMFRKGGNVGTGVMTGIVDRGNYANGPGSDGLNLKLNEEDIQERVDLIRGGGQDMSSDRITDFLLQFGPNLLSQTPKGKGFKGLLATAGEAAKDPIKDMIGAKRAERSEDVALRAKAIDALGQDDLKKIRAQAQIVIGPKLENESVEDYTNRLENKMSEYIESTYAKSPFLKTESPEAAINNYANDMRKEGEYRNMPTAKRRAKFELSDYDKLRAAKVNIQLPRAEKLKNKKFFKTKAEAGVYYDDITDTYTRVGIAENGDPFIQQANITFEELIQN